MHPRFINALRRLIHHSVPFHSADATLSEIDPGGRPAESSANSGHPKESVHVPVMPAEILKLGEPGPGQYWIDGTAGGGGHSQLIAERIGEQGRLLAIDRDPAAVERLRPLLPENVRVEQASYHEIPKMLERLEWPLVDGILLDLGLSSDQLGDAERGFSFQTQGHLDMRFDPTRGKPVSEWLRYADEKTIADTIYEYGEERFSRRIARRIVEQRRLSPIETAEQLKEIIYRSIPGGRRSSRGGIRHGRVDPATRTFQALRIFINDELKILRSALEKLPNHLRVGGRLLILSFHSLEDRIVKHHLREDLRLEVVTKKPLSAGEQEVHDNPRSRSAKLRVARRAANG